MAETDKNDLIHNLEPDDIFRMGTVGRLLRMLKLPDGRVKALVQGVARAKISRYVRKKSFYRVRINRIFEEPVEEITIAKP